MKNLMRAFLVTSTAAALYASPSLADPRDVLAKDHSRNGAISLTNTPDGSVGKVEGRDTDAKAGVHAQSQHQQAAMDGAADAPREDTSKSTSTDLRDHAGQMQKLGQGQKLGARSRHAGQVNAVTSNASTKISHGDTASEQESSDGRGVANDCGKLGTCKDEGKAAVSALSAKVSVMHEETDQGTNQKSFGSRGVSDVGQSRGTSPVPVLQQSQKHVQKDVDAANNQRNSEKLHLPAAVSEEMPGGELDGSSAGDSAHAASFNSVESRSQREMPAAHGSMFISHSDNVDHVRTPQAFYH